MYVPPHYRESRAEVLHGFIRRHPLATLVARTTQGLEANHVPMELLADAGSIRLRGHLARANPLWREAIVQEPVLAIFTGADGYVSPSWYPSKREHGRVVPTWNYATVHARGSIRFVGEAVWLRAQVEALTDAQERGRTQPWRVGDAPEDYVAAMLRAIVGFEIEVSGLEGKFKSSQNKDAGDRAGVAAGFTARGLAGPDLDELLR